MPSNSLEPGLPLLIVVEGENDIRFLKAISAILHREDADLPDLAQLTAERRANFLPTCGNNLNEWVSRVVSLRKRAFYLFDREQEPETSERQLIVEGINQRQVFRACLTSKRTVENYLHPLAILDVCGIELAFDDDADVASLLALRMMARSGESSWHNLPYTAQGGNVERGDKAGVGEEIRRHDHDARASAA